MNYLFVKLYFIYATFRYIVENKKEIMKKTMTAAVRTKCGLGDPPSEYTQNANECVNSLLKSCMEKKTLSVKETVRLVHQEVINQNERLNMAIIGKGNWRIRETYADKLQVSEEKYYQLSKTQRER